MTERILDLAGANVLELALGAGLLPVIRLARTRRELLGRLPLAYAVGVAATGILAADLAVVDVPVGWIVLSALTALSLAFGLRRLPAGEPTARARSRLLLALPAYGVLAITGAFGVLLARLFVVKPLSEGDGWVIWATRARALYDFGHPVAPVFTDPSYPSLQHPLLLPALEALDFRAMGTFDGTLVHLQLLAFAIAFVGGAWTLLRDHAPRLPLAASLLAIVAAPWFIFQLESNFADIPLGIFVSLGGAALAAWVASGTTGLLPAATLFLGAGALTKNEGEVFALAAFIAAAAVSRRAQLRPLAYAALTVLAIDLPWRIWIQVNHVKIAEYSIADLFNPSYLYDHRSRVWPSARELAVQIGSPAGWSYLAPIAALGLVGALLLRRPRPALFAMVWLALCFAGLVAIYWISTNPLTNHLYNSSYRTVASLVMAGALLAPVLIHREAGVR